MRLAARKPVLVRRFPAGLLIVLGLAVCGPAWAQEQELDRQRPVRDVSPSRRSTEPSDLAKENLNHLAASPAQVKEVLSKDAGLLVELKRLAIKEATDNGQIVEASRLSDQAIFDRLERDIAFRSVATHLVQRYGYLLPSFNADSELGKERELILKERARRQVQMEAQDDAEAEAELKSAANGESLEDCDRVRQEGCTEAAPLRTRRNLLSPNGGQGQAPDYRNSPSVPQQPPSLGQSQILRTSGGASESGLGGSPDTGAALQQLGSMQGDRGGFGQGGQGGQGAGEDGVSGEIRASRVAHMMAASQGTGAGGIGAGLSLPL